MNGDHRTYPQFTHLHCTIRTITHAALLSPSLGRLYRAQRVLHTRTPLRTPRNLAPHHACARTRTRTPLPSHCLGLCHHAHSRTPHTSWEVIRPLPARRGGCAWHDPHMPFGMHTATSSLQHHFHRSLSTSILPPPHPWHGGPGCLCCPPSQAKGHMPIPPTYHLLLSPTRRTYLFKLTGRRRHMLFTMVRSLVNHSRKNKSG